MKWPDVAALFIQLLNNLVHGIFYLGIFYFFTNLFRCEKPSANTSEWEGSDAYTR